MITLNPYLSFRTEARAALEFYREVLGGELMITTFADYPDTGIDPEAIDLVMHGQLTTPDGLVLMASDVPPSMPFADPAGFAVSISGDDEERLQAVWEGLSEGATVTIPYGPPPWGGMFGMLTDHFGIDWMVNASS